MSKKTTELPTSPSMHQQVSLTSCAPKASSCSPKPKLRLSANTWGWKHPKQWDR